MEMSYLDPDRNPYELEIKLVDDLKPGEVVVLACGGSTRIAPWGSLLSTASVARRAGGCVTDGLVRDIMTIRALRFPVFHGGIGPLDSKHRGQIMAIDVPVTCAGVLVAPGDLVIGDADGVVVVPQSVEPEVLRLVQTKLSSESLSIAELAAGVYLRDVYARHGVL
jgi:regulator of RNase E activity RraA